MFLPFGNYQLSKVFANQAYRIILWNGKISAIFRRSKRYVLRKTNFPKFFELYNRAQTIQVESKTFDFVAVVVSSKFQKWMEPSESAGCAML